MSGSSLTPLVEAIDVFRAGRMAIIVDDEDRENEGDLVIAAEHATPAAINFMATHGRGLVCLAMHGAMLDRLQIPMMVPELQNRSGFGTSFTVSIEAVDGVTTGISVADRAHTIATLINPATRPADLAMPGHVFPLRARDGGVLERRGQTEASVDLARLAGLAPAGVICEVMREDGTMMRLAELLEFAREHDMPVISVEQIADHRRRTERRAGSVSEWPAGSDTERNDGTVAKRNDEAVAARNGEAGAMRRDGARSDGLDVALTGEHERAGSAEELPGDKAISADGNTAANTSAHQAGSTAEAGGLHPSTPDLVTLVGRSRLPTVHGDFDITVFRDAQGFEHSALTRGDLAANAAPPLVRVHSECLTGDTFGSLRCDCGPQLHEAMRLVHESGCGAVLYLRQEGRGIGLGNKIRAYTLQDGGLDTVEANRALGFPDDARRYEVAAAMLDALGIGALRLLSNNPHKRRALEESGVRIIESLPLLIAPQTHNAAYLRTKVERMGHEIPAGTAANAADDGAANTTRDALVP